MPAWLTVYARRSADPVTPARLLAELRAADLETLAEAHDVAPKLARAAEAALRVDGETLDGLEIRYRAPELRPIQVQVWTSPARVAEEIEELHDGGRSLPQEIEAVLEEVMEVVAFELGFGMYDDMGIVIAWEAARIVAHATRGVVRDDDKRWSLVDERGSFRHLE